MNDFLIENIISHSYHKCLIKISETYQIVNFIYIFLGDLQIFILRIIIILCIVLFWNKQLKAENVFSKIMREKLLRILQILVFGLNFSTSLHFLNYPLVMRLYFRNNNVYEKIEKKYNFPFCFFNIIICILLKFKQL